MFSYPASGPLPGGVASTVALDDLQRLVSPYRVQVKLAERSACLLQQGDRPIDAELDAAAVVQNVVMPNIATVLKSEISRIARKELRSEAEGLKKTIASQRSDLATLKRRVQDLEKALRLVARMAASPKRSEQGADEKDEGGQFRFRAAGMATNRKRLGLSAADFGLLVGASGQSVYAWETGKAKPRAQNLAAIAALRGVGKREVTKKLAELKQQ